MRQALPSDCALWRGGLERSPYAKHIKNTAAVVTEVFFFFLLFRADPVAYGGSQARGPIGAEAASLHHSHKNVRSEPCLRPTPQLMATPDP